MFDKFWNIVKNIVKILGIISNNNNKFAEITSKTNILKKIWDDFKNNKKIINKLFDKKFIDFKPIVWPIMF